jgi:putative transcriptional regulator
LNAKMLNDSKALARLRQELGVSQEDFARQLGVSFATVNRWENGRHNPSRMARARLAAFRKKQQVQAAANLAQKMPPPEWGKSSGSAAERSVDAGA